MLRGTALRNNAAKYGYKYNAQAPYEIISNNDISNDELRRIHSAEHALERYWNSGKFRKTMDILTSAYYKGQYFQLFDEIGQYSNLHPQQGTRLESTFLHLHNFLLSKNINLFDNLRADYYSNFKVRPHGFWENKLEKKFRKQLLYQIGNDKSFITEYGLSRKIVEKQAAIDHVEGNVYQLTIFFSDKENLLVYYSFK